MVALLYSGLLLLPLTLTTALPPPHSLSKRALTMAMSEGNVVMSYNVRSQTYHLYDRENTHLGSLSAAEAKPHLAKRSKVPAGCFEMTSAQIDSIAGIAKLEDKQNQCWGGGAVERYVNKGEKQEHPDFKAWRCIDNPLPIEDLVLDGEPKCHSSDMDIQGESEGSNATIKFVWEVSKSQSATHSVSNNEKVSIGVSFASKFEIPFVGGTSVTASTNFEYAHEDNKATSEETSEKHGFEISFSNPTGKSCTARFRTDICELTGKSTIRTQSGGHVWYRYDRAKKASTDDCRSATGDVGDFWAAPLSWLSEEERMVRTPLESAVNTDITAKYKIWCDEDGDFPDDLDFDEVDPSKEQKIKVDGATTPSSSAPASSDAPASSTPASLDAPASSAPTPSDAPAPSAAPPSSTSPAEVQTTPTNAKRNPQEGPVSILSAFKPGTCGFHLTHFQKPDPSRDPYKVEVILKDGAGAEVGRNDPTAAPAGVPVPVLSRLPIDLVVITGNVDADLIQFEYGGDKWSTDTQGRCSVGAYDSGDREMDCSFTC